VKPAPQQVAFRAELWRKFTLDIKSYWPPTRNPFLITAPSFVSVGSPGNRTTQQAQVGPCYSGDI
jgi:hypothetical protein